jgi:hypothetical protein
MERYIPSDGPTTTHSHRALWVPINMAVIWNAIELFVTVHAPHQPPTTFDLLLCDLETCLNMKGDTGNNSYFFAKFRSFWLPHISVLLYSIISLCSSPLRLLLLDPFIFLLLLLFSFRSFEKVLRLILSNDDKWWKFIKKWQCYWIKQINALSTLKHSADYLDFKYLCDVPIECVFPMTLIINSDYFSQHLNRLGLQWDALRTLDFIAT